MKLFSALAVDEMLSSESSFYDFYLKKKYCFDIKSEDLEQCVFRLNPF
jgi:hypothetical protein